MTDASTQSPQRRLPFALRALRHRNFQLFFAGQLISLTGTWMQSVAQAWLVYRMTGSASLLGLVGFATQLPVFLLAPVGGAIADRHQRHRIIVCTQIVAMVLAFILAGITLAGVVEVWHIFVLAAMIGTVNALDIPTRQSFIVEMVGQRDLINAIALNSSMVNGARIAGPAVAGVLVATVGEGWCFMANAVSYLAVIAGLLAMNVRRRTIHAPHLSAAARIVEGFQFVARTPPIRALLLLLGLVSLMGMPYSVLMPVFADEILGGGARELGLLTGATGVGAVVGAISLAMRRGIFGLARVVAIAAAGFGVFLIVFSLSKSFWLSVAILMPSGFCMMVEMAASNTLIQAMSPDALRGRVMAVYSMMFMGMAPFGALLAGFLAERIGAPNTVALGGVVCIAGACVFALRLSALRVQARQLIVAQQVAAGEPPEEATGGAVAVERRP